MTEIGWAALGIAPSFDGFQGKLERGTDKAMFAAGQTGGATFGESAGKSAGSKFGSVFKTAAKASLVGIGALGFGAFKLGQDAVSLAGEFEQSLGAVDAIFKDNSKTIHRWAQDAAMDVGLSANEFNELGTLIGAQLKNGGTAMEDLAPKTKELITAGADMASMFGGTTKEAVEALSSALKGERDPIERYGVSLTQAKIDAEAAELGFKKVDGALSSQATQAATLSLIMEQTADSHGNFAAEADTLAGKQQRLAARMEDVKTELGTALLPIMSDAADFLIEKGVPAFERFSDWFTDEGVPALKDFGGFVKDDVLPVLEDIGGFAKDAAGEVKDLVGFLGDLPKPAKIAGLVALVGGIGAAKLRKGGPGALGTAGSVLGLAKGTPVFVTNWAMMAGGGIPGAGGAMGKKGIAAFAAGAARVFWPAMLAAGSAYGAYKFTKFYQENHVPDPGDAGTREHAQKIAAHFRNAGKFIESYNDDLESARDKVIELTNGVTGFSSETERARDKVLDLTRPKYDVDIDAPGLPGLMNRTKTYSEILNDMDGRIVRIHFQTIQDKNVILPGQTGPKRGSPDDGRSGTTINIDRVVAQDYRDFSRQMEERRLRNSMSGRRSD